VAVLPEDSRESDGENDEDDDVDVIARQLKKKLTKLGKSKREDEAYPLLSAVETDVVPVQTEVNELKWTDARKIYRWRREASHKRFRDVEIEQNAREICKREAAQGVAKTTVEAKVALLRQERDETDALLREASQLTWRSLQREVKESVVKMQDKTHHEHEKFRDGSEIKRLLSLVKKERKRVVRAKYGKGPRAIIIRKLDYYGLISRERWCPDLGCGPRRSEMVTAIRAMWAKKLEQYQNLGKLMRMMGPNAPTILLGTLFSMMESAVRPLALKYQADMVRALETGATGQVPQAFRSLIYSQLIVIFLQNLGNR